ncbi:carbonic anhydrase [bacterium AH-315-E07]|nr:carbonic anhydrase [bacterium AH-315-E07]
MRVQTAETHAKITPEVALTLLKEGNQRFVSGKMYKRDLRKKALITSKGQYPYAAIVGCIDSRASHELLFDAGIGDIFSARVAGNFANTDILGSLEFATAIADAKLIVVLGHSECGAIKGACDNLKMGNLTHTLSNIAPAIYSVEGFEGKRNSKNKAFVDAVAHANVELTVEHIVEASPIIKALSDKRQLMVVGAMLDIVTGKVTFMEPS